LNNIVTNFTERRTEQTLGEMTSTLFHLREKKAEIEQKRREINKCIEDLEFKIITQMDEAGLDKMSVAEGSVSRKVELYPRIEDKDTFVNWAIKNGFIGMITAQVNRAQFKEYFENFNEYPDGVDAFEKEKLNHRRSR